MMARCGGRKSKPSSLATLSAAPRSISPLISSSPGVCIAAGCPSPPAPPCGGRFCAVSVAASAAGSSAVGADSPCCSTAMPERASSVSISTSASAPASMVLQGQRSHESPPGAGGSVRWCGRPRRCVSGRAVQQGCSAPCVRAGWSGCGRVRSAAAIGRLCGSGRSSEAAVRRTFRLLPPLLLVAARWVGALAGCSDSGI